MTEVMVVQGREVTAADIELIRTMLAAHPARGRTPLSEELCRRWDWRKNAWSTQGHGLLYAAAEAGAGGPHPVAAAHTAVVERLAQSSCARRASGVRAHSRRVARPAPAARGGRRAGLGRCTPVQRPARPRALFRTP